MFKQYLKATLFISILIGLCVLSNYYFTRIDLTNDQKYSVTSTTKEFIKKIDDIIYLKVYLHGDLPVEYQRLEDAVRHILQELRLSSEYIQYEFIDIYTTNNDEYIKQMGLDLQKKGIYKVVRKSDDSGKEITYDLFPGIIATYKNKEEPILLLKENNIEKSIIELEYSLMSTIINLTKNNNSQTNNIGLITGHGENTDSDYMLSFKNLLEKEKYNLTILPPINGRLNALKNIDCIIINDPTETFTEKDKFIIDQFIMNGGRSIWITHNSTATLDSLINKSSMIAMPIENRNLNDLLFKYGVRINNDLIQDLQCIEIPIVTHIVDNKPQWNFRPWIFFPMSNGNPNHIITENINPCKLEFTNSIDIIKNQNTTSTILLSTSGNTKTLPLPTLIDLESLKETANKNLFNQGKKNTAVLLSGVFQSIFTNRIPLAIQKDSVINFKSNSKKNHMIIISDGEFITNDCDYDLSNCRPYPIGYDMFNGVQYGNQEFILNSIEYLLNTDSTASYKNELLINVRAKKLDLRPINNNKLKENKIFWQLLNIILPLFIILILYLILKLIRFLKYKN